MCFFLGRLPRLFWGLLPGWAPLYRALAPSPGILCWIDVKLQFAHTIARTRAARLQLDIERDRDVRDRRSTAIRAIYHVYNQYLIACQSMIPIFSVNVRAHEHMYRDTQDDAIGVDSRRRHMHC